MPCALAVLGDRDLEQRRAVHVARGADRVAPVAERAIVGALRLGIELRERRRREQERERRHEPGARLQRVSRPRARPPRGA